MITLSIGRRRRGKTTLVVYMARKVPARMVFDPRGLVGGPGSFLVTRAADLPESMDRLYAGEIAEVVFTPADDNFQGAFRAFADAGRQWVQGAPLKPLAIVVDEISFVSLDEPAFQWVLRCSDPAIVHVLLTCHRPMDVPVGIRAIADYWCLFQARQEHDIKVIDERCSPAVARAVRGLEGRAWVLWDEGRAAAATYADPKVWYVPLRVERAAPAVDLMDPEHLGPGEGLTRGKLFD
jgi:hypothetical protein